MGTVITNKITWQVWYRDNFGAPWTADTNLLVDRIDVALAPTVSNGDLTRYYGYIDKTTETPSGAVVLPLDLRDKLVWIRLTRGTDTFDFYGVVQNQQDQVGVPLPADYEIAAGQSAKTGMTKYKVFGLEYWLAKYKIEHAWLEGKAGTTNFTNDALVHRPLPFNDRDKYGQIVGNRATDRDNVIGAYLFTDTPPATANGNQWTAWQVLEYLLRLFEEISEIRYWFNRDSWHESLDYLVDVWNFEGMTYYQALNELINPGFGWGWMCRGDIDGEAEITVLPLVLNDVTDGDNVVLPGNSLSFDIDLDTAQNIAQSVITYPEDTRYHQLEVIGDPLRVIFTMSYDYGSMADGWTAAEETAYNALDDDALIGEQYKKVFCRLILPTTWNGTANAQKVLVQVDSNDGSLDITQLQRNWARGQLRLGNTIPDFLDPDGAAERPMLVLCKDSLDEYFNVAKGSLVDTTLFGNSVKSLRDDVGIQILARYPHFFGVPGYTGTSAQSALVEHEDVIATVSLVTDEPVHVVRVMRFQQNGEEIKLKTITVPGAGIWWAPKDTVYDFSATALTKVTAAAGQTLRDDSQILERIANMAEEFYGRERAELVVEYGEGIIVDILGYILDQVTQNGSVVPGGTVCNRVTYDLTGKSQRTVFETDYNSLDFRMMARRRAAGGSNERMRSIAARLDQTPAVVAEPGAGGGAYDGPFAVTQGPSTNLVYVGDNIRNTLGVTDFIDLHPTHVQKTTRESLTITVTGYVYYQIRRDTQVVSLLNAAALPTANATTGYVPLAYVTFSGGAVTSIVQIQYGNITWDSLVEACPTT
jgi:hypothetical protein